jgi:hypothetical protein
MGIHLDFRVKTLRIFPEVIVSVDFRAGNKTPQNGMNIDIIITRIPKTVRKTPTCIGGFLIAMIASMSLFRSLSDFGGIVA